VHTKLKKILLFDEHVCPWWFAYTYDHRLRRLFHNPEIILKPYVRAGMTVIDIGCGMGYFSIAMAKMVGENGKVISVDLQQKMLDILSKRAEHEKIPPNIIKHKCDQDNIDIKQKADFALTFWMVHEVSDKLNFLKQIYTILKSDGHYLLVEPKIHTATKHFNEIVTICRQIGFREFLSPKIFMSRALVMIR